LNGKRVIGLDLGGTKILAGVVDRDGHVEQRREHPTPTASQDELLAGLDAAGAGLLADGDGAVIAERGDYRRRCFCVAQDVDATGVRRDQADRRALRGGQTRPHE